MIEVFKYRHNLYDINPNPLPLHHGSVTRGHNFKLEKRRPEKSARQKFFTMRAVNEWNALPADIAEATTLNSFKYLDLINTGPIACLTLHGYNQDDCHSTQTHI